MGTTSVRRRVTLGGVASAGTTVREGEGGAAVGGVASAGTAVREGGGRGCSGRCGQYWDCGEERGGGAAVGGVASTGTTVRREGEGLQWEVWPVLGRKRRSACTITVRVHVRSIAWTCGMLQYKQKPGKLCQKHSHKLSSPLSVILYNNQENGWATHNS